MPSVGVRLKRSLVAADVSTLIGQLLKDFTGLETRQKYHQDSIEGIPPQRLYASFQLIISVIGPHKSQIRSFVRKFS